LNVVERFLPILVIALIAASVMSAAISPYSIAAAPVSSASRSARKRVMRVCDGELNLW
jgi:hypothetical protein